MQELSVGRASSYLTFRKSEFFCFREITTKNLRLSNFYPDIVPKSKRMKSNDDVSTGEFVEALTAVKFSTYRTGGPRSTKFSMRHGCLHIVT